MPITAVPPGDVVAPPRSRANLATVGALTAAWLLPLATHLLGVDVVLPAVALVAVASLLRVGTGLLDRLVLSAAMLVGGTCAAGLLLSVWPWHLQPVPMAIALFTGLVLAARVGRRAPQLRLPVGPADVLCLLLAGATVLLASMPYWHGGHPAHLDLLMLGDNYNHLGVYDVIRVTGGYLFEHGEQARAMLLSGLVGYPQGMHLTWAVLTSFAWSSAAPGPPGAALDPFIWLGLLTYGFFTLSVLWVVNRLSGRAPGLWWRVPPLVGAAAFCAFGPLITLYIRGFPAQVAGLAMLVFLVGLLAGPGRQPTADVLAVAGACVVGVAFTYYFLLPVAAVALAAWAWPQRRALWSRPGWPLLTAVVTIVLAGVPVAVNRSGSEQALEATRGGSVEPLPRNLLLMGVLVLVAAAAARPGPARGRPAEVLLASVAGAVVFTVGLSAYQHRVSYYGEKAMYTVLVLTLCALGVLAGRATARLSRPDRGTGGTAPARGTRGRGFAAALAFSVAAVLPFGYTGPLAEQGARRNVAVKFAAGDIGYHGVGKTIVRTLDRPAPPGTVSVYFDTMSYRYLDRDSTQLLDVLSRTWTDRALRVASLVGAGRPDDALERIVRSSPVPVRIVTSNPRIARLVGELTSRYPARPISLLQVPPTMATRWGKVRL